MYGLLLEAICYIIKKDYGEEKWDEISRQAGIQLTCFSTHDVYSENLIQKIAQAAADVLGKQANEIMYQFGEAFVIYVGHYGYDDILKVLGRNMRDFLNGLDNLHEYLRFSYPKMRAPSFFVEDETRSGLTLHYRTRRRGFVHYVMGQIRQVGKVFYDTDVEIHVVSQQQNETDGTMHVTFHLAFDNAAFRDAAHVAQDSIVDNIPLRSELLFDLFPFHVVFDRSLTIHSVGAALRAVIPYAVGQPLPAIFHQFRPLTPGCNFSFDEVLAHTNNVFQLVSMKPIQKCNASHSALFSSSSSSAPCDPETSPVTSPISKEVDDWKNHLHLKGQMLSMREWGSIMFLGTPLMQNLDDMFDAGLFINDLSMHDCSRDLVLAGTQQSAELKLALEQERQKSRLLGESMKKLDTEMKRTDTLLYQMIPKPVADQLRRGEPSVATCQAFDCVTILFSDVVGFTTICSRITPMQVVSMLNAMYTLFDNLSETHDVYKVETIGDAYMAVAGAPTVTDCHALSMCDMALDMLRTMDNLKDPSTHDSMRIRIGIHTGSTVAGVVGIKMPRYCLFGDTVNTASRMESNGEAMKIHISETTRQMLIKDYILQERGQIEVKGKGSMKTYWLCRRVGLPIKERRQLEAEEEREEEGEKDRMKDGAATGRTAVDKAGISGRSTPRDGLRDRRAVHSVVSSHRHIYSPVSFDDLSSDTAHRESPFGTPTHQQHHQYYQHPVAIGGGGGGVEDGGTEFCQSQDREEEKQCRTDKAGEDEIRFKTDKAGEDKVGKDKLRDKTDETEEEEARHGQGKNKTGEDEIRHGQDKRDGTGGDETQCRADIEVKQSVLPEQSSGIKVVKLGGGDDDAVQPRCPFQGFVEQAKARALAQEASDDFQPLLGNNVNPHHHHHQHQQQQLHKQHHHQKGNGIDVTRYDRPQHHHHANRTDHISNNVTTTTTTTTLTNNNDKSRHVPHSIPVWKREEVRGVSVSAEKKKNTKQEEEKEGMERAWDCTQPNSQVGNSAAGSGSISGGSSTSSGSARNGKRGGGGHQKSVDPSDHHNTDGRSDRSGGSSSPVSHRRNNHKGLYHLARSNSKTCLIL